MKKILLLLAVLFLVTTNCKAADWVEFASKTYFDQSALRVEDSTVSFWMKSLNGSIIGGPQYYVEPSRKPWYMISLVAIWCGNQQSHIDTDNLIVYGTSSKVIAHPASSRNELIYPDTVADVYLVKKFCPMTKEIRFQGEY